MPQGFGKQACVSKVKLLVITRENAADKNYGLGRTLLPFIQAMRERGHEVVYFSQTECTNTHQRWLGRFIAFLRPFFGLIAPALAERLIQGIAGGRHAVRIKATHVWLHDPWMALGYQWGRWSQLFFKQGRFKQGAEFKQRPKMFISEHGLGSFTWAVSRDGLTFSPRLFRWFLAFERRTLNKADKVFTPSQTALDALLRDLAYIKPPQHFVILPYGKPPQIKTIPSPDFSIFGFEAPPAVPVILAVGRISPAKNYQLLVDAVHLLDQQTKQGVQLLIAGGGDVQPLLDYAASKPLRHILRTAFIQDMPKAYVLADLYISSCAIESFGQANREAMAFGLPCVVPSAGASGEVLGNGAWLVPPKADSMANAIYRLISNPNQALFWKQQALLEYKKLPIWADILELFEQQLLND